MISCTWCIWCRWRWKFCWCQSHKQWCLLHSRTPDVDTRRKRGPSTETSRRQSTEWWEERRTCPAATCTPTGSTWLACIRTHLSENGHELCEDERNQVSEMHGFWWGTSPCVQVKRFVLLMPLQHKIQFSTTNQWQVILQTSMCNWKINVMYRLLTCVKRRHLSARDDERVCQSISRTFQVFHC